MDENLQKMLLINKIRGAEACSNTENVTKAEIECLQGKYNAMYKWPVEELEDFIKEAGID